MRAVDLIRLKRDGGTLDAAGIRAFVSGATDGSWPDYQLAALLMAIVLRGMTVDEASTLTAEMVRSGDRLDLSEFGRRAVDKHSTGGVGDKTSLVVAPLAAVCGVVVPMMSGRGLGHTGGTLDKLAAIPGFRTSLSLTEMTRVLRRVGCAFIGQSDQIAPADRRLYALRDVTGTVESVPLIASSILSKKIAEGICGLVLDVKVGRGAFMKTLEEARTLASTLLQIADRSGLDAEAVLTAMDAPLGRAIGNATEVIEAIETLKGRGPADLEMLSVRLAARMVVLAGIEADDEAAEAAVRRALVSGAGLERFGRIVEAQGGDPGVLDDYTRLPGSEVQEPILAAGTGFIEAIDAECVGRAAVVLGAGRDRVDAPIDHGAGIELLFDVGDRVCEGEPVAIMLAATADRCAETRALLSSAISVGPAAPTCHPLILETLTSGVRPGEIRL
ncbi:MAG: thymidine phosphorylase [Vicinamibacterales bacterium]